MHKQSTYSEDLYNVSRWPLSWPETWARVKAENRKEARFGKRAGRRITTQEGVNRLLEEMEKIDAEHIVISTNVPQKSNGLPGSDPPTVDDPGVSVYFTLNGTACCLACDKWDRVGDNLTAIASHLKSIRDQTRWGVGSVSQAFRGYNARPEDQWWTTLGVDKTASPSEARTAFRTKAKKAHPDQGGSHHDMADLNRAWRTAQKFYESQE